MSDSKKQADLPLSQVTVAELSDASVTPTTTELDKNAFNNLSAFGFSFAVLNTWVVLVVGLGSSLISGGPSAAFWGFIYAFLCNLAITMSHSEILAVFPTAGGQWHWVAMLSPENWRASLSWTTGVMNVVALWLGQSTVGYLSTSLIISAILVNDPAWAPTPAQQYGIFVAVTAIGPLVTPLLGVRGNRLLDSVLMTLSILTSLALVMTLFATASPKASGAFVFGGLYNVSGWDSMVIAWLLGILQSAFSFLGFDIVYHISEELPNPRREGPKVVNMTIIVGGFSGILVTLAMLFSVSDIEAVLGTAYALPFAQVVMDATGSKAATTLFVAIPAVLFMNSSRGISACASRVLLSMGRDNVLPFSKSFEIVKMGEPLVGLALSTVVAILLGLVQLGSTAAFNSLLGSATIMFQFTYVMPPVMMLLGGRKRLNEYMPGRTFNLGKWGIVANVISCFFVLEGCVIYCFPASLPVEPGSMNYVIVYVSGISVILAALWYGWARHRFHGPSEEAIMAISNREKAREAELSRL
ncbi:amino acid/polyamine transporter I [Papiliotrema laurentii]|uniref:Amino acid/polyamine transporter I n=1 Tax=Papiliotrema laurentii TaxID=5418 RepID=A0AAD9FS63_PAPLA|nr:amino acid/polyamine transporter I [Papiliotrema laurentii]